MASSSNSSMALVPLSRRNHYDVFVTFRGEDTRNNFVDFLFDAFERGGIYAFKDDTNIEKGKFIGPELIRAIEGSQIFVAVFSRNYASSTWCLQELEKICECIVSGKHVLPVFYDVDPSVVRKQSGIYCESFVKHEERFQQDPQQVSRWREALKQVGNFSGWDLRDKPQSREMKKIVQTIMNILKYKSSCVSKDLVGINSPIEALQNHLLLDSDDGVRVIGICGMGGIGKTALAMTLYGQISHRFSASCFIDDVSKIYRSGDGPLDAQKQILLQTVGIEHNQICNHYSATNLMRINLCHERALLILDNVDQVGQLEKIAVRREWLGAGSRIIIISRDEHILKEYGVDVVYKVPLLNQAESHMLFCRKAFKVEKTITSNYQNLADEILNYANGLPLAITVLGSFLFGCNVTEWKSALSRLRESPDNNVMDVLQISFDGLNLTEKEMFLHIACFFNFLPEKRVKNILNCCGFHADIGLRVLLDKSLISIDNSIIKMHYLLEELGRKIVQESSSKEQRKWSRLWSHEQIYNVMMEKMEKHVEAISLIGWIDMIVQGLSKMSNLRLLIIISFGNYGGNVVSESPNCLSNKLRYVQWLEYPFKYLPSSFHPYELVELILERSSITQLWTNKKYLPNLRKLDLSHSINLVKIIDFGEFPNLEWLSLEECRNLVELDPSIGLLEKLSYLNLDGCYSLESIPNNIFSLSSLEDLNMRGCSKVFDDPMHLKKPDISESASQDSTDTYLLPLLCRLYLLRTVDISFCRLSHVPDAIECLRSLERLNLGGNYFVTLPSLWKLSKLVYLNLEHCELLESLPQLPSPTSIGRDRRENKWWTTGLVIFNCPKLAESEREHCRSMTFSWMAQFIKAYPHSYPAYLDEFHIVVPGSEIPNWINNHSMGDSIPIEFSPPMHDNINDTIGFVCCAVFSVAPPDSIFTPWDPPWVRITGISDIKLKIPVIINGSFRTTKSSHLWIIYFPRGSRHEFRKIHFDIFSAKISPMRVKSCGYRWVCKHDLQELRKILGSEVKEFGN